MGHLSIHTCIGGSLQAADLIPAIASLPTFINKCNIAESV